MNYFTGKTLSEYQWESIPLDARQLREIASCCLLGMDYLHNRGILHGVSNFES